MQDQHLPQTGKVAIYTRVASPMKLAQNPARTEQLIVLAKHLGFAEQQIIIFAQDRGRPGSTSIAQREGLAALLAALGQESMQAVLVADDNRLFRDAEATQVDTFIRLCVERSVLVITPQTTYDLTNPAHVTLFRFHCEHGYSLVENIFADK